MQLLIGINLLGLAIVTALNYKYYDSLLMQIYSIYLYCYSTKSLLNVQDFVGATTCFGHVLLCFTTTISIRLLLTFLTIFQHRLGK